MLLKDLRKNINDSEIDTTIISLVLDCPKSSVFLLSDIPDKQAQKCLKIAEGYKAGVPIVYQTKCWSFYELPLKIDKNVLIPRFETELLVQNAIYSVQGTDNCKILDLCTGSGAIAIALAKHTAAEIAASDICEKALKVARANAILNKVKVNFVQGNLFENIIGKFDVIVCNPPYIKTSEIGKYDKTTLHEPRIALDGGEDGLRFYREIISQAQQFLKPYSFLILEIGHDQADEVKQLLKENNFREIEIVKDMSNRDRVVVSKTGHL